MNQTINDMSGQLGSVADIAKQVKSLMNRVDALESRPDEQKKMLAEYARNWDTLNDIIKGTYDNEQSVASQLNDKMSVVADSVNNKQIIFDQQTIDSLVAYVRDKSDVGLKGFVKKIVDQRIDKDIAASQKLIDGRLLHLRNDVDNYTASSRKTLSGLKWASRSILTLWVVLAGVVLLTVLADFSQIISTFAKHPLISSVVLVVLVGLFAAGAWLIKKRDDDD